MIPINTLLEAYRTGFFPMATRGRIRWYSPHLRGVLPLNRFHVPRRMRRVLRQGRFRCTVNQAFRQVIASCAARHADEGAWIDTEIFESYCILHEAGFAHSVEAWCGERLAGGLYGVALGGAFFGESMFSTRTDASKAALCALVERLQGRGFQLLDTQWLTSHLARFGGIEVGRDQYLRLLAAAVALPCSFVDRDPSARACPEDGSNRLGGGRQATAVRRTRR